MLTAAKAKKIRDEFLDKKMEHEGVWEVIFDAAKNGKSFASFNMSYAPDILPYKNRLLHLGYDVCIGHGTIDITW